MVVKVRVNHRDAIRVMLADVRFPAPLWQLVAQAQAQSWGAAAECVDQLNQLPTAIYQHLTEVLAALGEPPALPQPRPALPSLGRQ